MNKLETLLFTYDFNDLPSVANVVTDLQTSLRDALETELIADISHLTAEAAKLEMLKLKAHKMVRGIHLTLCFLTPSSVASLGGAERALRVH
jgi:hypothetical protein